MPQREAIIDHIKGNSTFMLDRSPKKSRHIDDESRLDDFWLRVMESGLWD
jgi:hypothetical protein